MSYMQLYMDEDIVRRVDLNILINLPAHGPEDHPHLIDVKKGFSNDYPPDDLTAVDAIATVLYKWNPQALSELLDLSVEYFRFGFIDNSRIEYYIIRKKHAVKTGVKGPDSDAPDFEVSYNIDENGAWKMSSCSDNIGSPGLSKITRYSFKEAAGKCQGYDRMFAESIIEREIWKRSGPREMFVYKVNRGDMMDGPENARPYIRSESPASPRTHRTTNEEDDGLCNVADQNTEADFKEKAMIPKVTASISRKSKKRSQISQSESSGGPHAKKVKVEIDLTDDEDDVARLCLQVETLQKTVDQFVKNAGKA